MSDTDGTPVAQEGATMTVSSSGGYKQTKLERYDLIPVEPLAELARLYGRGAEKYDDHNWRKGYEWSKSYAALQRHVNLFWGGESYDEETKRHHLASVIFHAMALMEFEKTHPEHDDRFLPASEPERELTVEDFDYERDWPIIQDWTRGHGVDASKLVKVLLSLMVYWGYDIKTGEPA